MADIPRIPLADRLRRAAAESGEPPYLHLYRLYVGSYFCGLDDLHGGSTYADTLDVALAPYLEKYETMPLLTTFVADSAELPAADQAQMLYQVLIRPFADLQQEKERTEKECLSLPF